MSHPEFVVSPDVRWRVENAFPRLLELVRGRYPGWSSFDHPQFHKDEIGYKRRATAQAANLLAEPRLRGYLERDQLAEMLGAFEEVGRRSRLLYHRSYSPPTGDMGILYRELPRQLFCEALYDLLYGPDSSVARLARYLEKVESWDLPSRWKFPTCFLFLCHPDREMFVAPRSTTAFLGLLGYPAREMLARPNPDAYDLILQVAAALFPHLQPFGAKDRIDVQGFLWLCGWVHDAGTPGPEPPALQARPVRLYLDNSGSFPEPERSFAGLLAHLRSRGLHFPAEQVSNYLLALQTRRFAILTGISGTGKTRLAREVARYLSGSCLVEAVRPDWTDNRGLLGYFNPLTGRYVRTPFLDRILEGREESGPVFVVLDEMNLARVEHYFSDFLSALESGEAIHLHDAPEVTDVPRLLEVPPNLYFTGTVNVDESTYMFSPKVLDRAFTLELNEVDLAALSRVAEGRETEDAGLRLDGLPDRLEPAEPPGASDWQDFGDLLDGELRRIVEDLNTLLARENRHFGYRVAVEIARFVNLAAEQSDGGEDSLRTALDLALLQKVLPKLHGTQQELEEILAALAGFAEDRPRLDRFAAKIGRMRRRLQRQGFTSFIE